MAHQESRCQNTLQWGQDSRDTVPFKLIPLTTPDASTCLEHINIKMGDFVIAGLKHLYIWMYESAMQCAHSLHANCSSHIASLGLYTNKILWLKEISGSAQLKHTNLHIWCFLPGRSFKVLSGIAAARWKCSIRHTLDMTDIETCGRRRIIFVRHQHGSFFGRMY